MYMIAGVLQYVAVASFAEAWIEMNELLVKTNELFVASFAEAWIEIINLLRIFIIFLSPPSRRRGLKFLSLAVVFLSTGRLLRGGVD